MLLMEKPAKAARLCGLTRLTDTLHGRWIREMVFGQGDMTLLAHRGSYKTTCLSFAMAVMLVVYPRKNLLFLRKTDSDVLEVLRQVKLLLATDTMQELTGRIYGSPVQVLRGDMWSVNTDCYAAIRGAPQLLGLGTGGSMTGKHADIILTDDIVNLQDRISVVERKRICGVYQELQNIRNPGGRILNTGTPWHPDDAFRLMPPPEKYDCYQTGLLTKDAIAKLRAAMSPTLFAANYELRHIATGGGLFEAHPPETEDPLLLRDGIAHLDASYGGEDFTALGGQFDSYRQQVETEKHQQARHANLRAALQSAGANPHALDLLLLALHPDESAFDGDEITDPDALLTPLKAQYGAFFAQPTRLPTDVVSPPVTAAPPLTKEDVRRMSQEDINRNWSSVCSVLSKGD